MAVLTESRDLPLLSDYPRFVRGHRVGVGVLMCLGLLFGFVWSMGQPATFSATASLVLTPVPKYLSPLSTAIAPPEVTIDTDAQLLRSPAVRTAVARILGTDADMAATHLSVTATPNSNILHVTVKAATARMAADAANAAVRALIDVRSNALGSLQHDQLRQLRHVVHGQAHALARAQAGQVVIPAADDLFIQLLDLKTSLSEVAEARKTPADVVDPAVPPRRHDYPNTEIPIVSGGMIGFLCGLMFGAARDRRLRIRHPLTARLLTRPFDACSGAVTPHEDCQYA